MDLPLCANVETDPSASIQVKRRDEFEGPWIFGPHVYDFQPLLKEYPVTDVRWTLNEAQIADLLKLIHDEFPRLEVNLDAPARVELSRVVAGLRHQAIEQSNLMKDWPRLERISMEIGEKHVEPLLHACAIANDLIEQDIERERKAAFAGHKDGGTW
jgi:hypothetical protein